MSNPQTTLADLRRAARERRVRPETVKKIYVLPHRLVAGILRHQADQRLPSEVAAFRELIEQGLRLKGR